MPLIHRVTRLFRADLHAVLDRVEEPDMLLKQAIREMEEAMAQDEQQLKVLNHEMGQLVARHDELQQNLTDLEAELDICFEAGHEDLAKALIKRKLETQGFEKFIKRRRQSLQSSITELSKRVEENRRRLDSMRQKAEVFSEDIKSREQDNLWSAPDFSVRDEDVDVAFLREKQKRSRP
jgi:phage shock protein A